MAVSRALRRLLRLLQLEEEQCLGSVEFAAGTLMRLERALETAAECARDGRRLVIASARSGDLADRFAGLEETRSAARRAAALQLPIEEAEQKLAELREAYLAKRIERRQTETLVQHAAAKEAIEAGRRGQQALDDWYLNQVHRTRPRGERKGIAVSAKTSRQSEGLEGCDKNLRTIPASEKWRY
jgi:hypothetical protein